MSIAYEKKVAISSSFLLFQPNFWDKSLSSFVVTGSAKYVRRQTISLYLPSRQS